MGLEESTDLEDNDASQGAKIGKDEEITVYRAIMNLHPSFEDVITACASHKHTLHNLIQMLENQSRSARNSDVSSLNGVICEFLKVDNDRITYDMEESPMPAKTNLQGHGWNHPLFTVLLSPYCRFIRICDYPEELSELMTEAKNAVVDISESEWPTFLYASDTIPDPDNDHHGHFRGNLLPVLALQPLATVKGRLNKAKIHKLTEVTGRTIAYICALVRIALRGRGWGTEDSAFDYEAFYQNIVKMFEDDPEDCWVIETLDWNGGNPSIPAGFPVEWREFPLFLREFLLFPLFLWIPYIP
ncbi:hypothetical protein GALMADRAFT_139825 [Galerina marginata CBS 339.88]|uniref:Uncharacterized protein n=1 Tax=Galerina marginata (strain CBS 339.88) TaxID=685588 RepID=A0A067SYW6_GALM3|nr:hypothetical protein GALMADRAFT_139825 [Galerina marginata CBS 339.88]